MASTKHDENSAPRISTEDARAAKAAGIKRAAGRKLNREEEAALKRFQKQAEEIQRLKYYADVPKRLWIKWSGRQHRELGDQAKLYNLPIGGKSINLSEFAKAFHDFLALRANLLATARDGEEGDVRTSAEADRQFKWAKAEREKIKLEVERSEVVSAKDAANQRLDVVRWATGVFERAGSELATVVAGRKPSEVKKIVDEYFQKLRHDMSK